ncbi:hypothetical protein AURDEDRAFT_115533 [Auricularia subglabra TFB-10046 SS5]|nr:hypothetical protein AURDEDRAFT_115533 [Auricularia subglabra TFB-10046 SS5]
MVILVLVLDTRKERGPGLLGPGLAFPSVGLAAANPGSEPNLRPQTRCATHVGKDRSPCDIGPAGVGHRR